MRIVDRLRRKGKEAGQTSDKTHGEMLSSKNGVNAQPQNKQSSKIETQPKEVYLEFDEKQVNKDSYDRSDIVKGVKFSDNVTRIGGEAFRSTDIEELVIPKNVTQIGDGAFAHCKNLKSVIIEGAATIFCDAFSGCDKLEKVIINDKDVKISSRAFAYCKNLKNVDISGAKFIDQDVFECSNNCVLSINGTKLPAFVWEYLDDYAKSRVEDLNFKYFFKLLKEIPPFIPYTYGSNAFLNLCFIMGVFEPDSHKHTIPQIYNDKTGEHEMLYEPEDANLVAALNNNNVNLNEFLTRPIGEIGAEIIKNMFQKYGVTCDKLFMGITTSRFNEGFFEFMLDENNVESMLKNKNEANKVCKWFIHRQEMYDDLKAYEIPNGVLSYDDVRQAYKEEVEGIPLQER